MAEEAGGIAGIMPPESFVNIKRYFVRFHASEWAAMTEREKCELVRAVLGRIDAEHPESGKIPPVDP